MQRVQGLLTLLFSVGTRQETSATSKRWAQAVEHAVEHELRRQQVVPLLSDGMQCTNESSISNE